MLVGLRRASKWIASSLRSALLHQDHQFSTEGPKESRTSRNRWRQPCSETGYMVLITEASSPSPAGKSPQTRAEDLVNEAPQPGEHSPA